MNYEYLIGFRYLRSKRKQKFVSVIGLISILGVFIGVMALNVVLGVMKGFEDELKNKILGVSSHLVVLNYDGPIENYRFIEEEIRSMKGVIGTSPFIYGQGMLRSDTGVTGTEVWGINPENAGNVSLIDEAVGKGSLQEDKDNNKDIYKLLGKEILNKLNENTETGKPPIILGKELIKNLHLSIGDVVSLISPFGKIGPFGPTAKVKRYEIIGISDFGLVDADSKYSYMSLNNAMDYFDINGRVSGVGISIANIYDSKLLSKSINSKLGFPFYTRNWEDVNKSLFKALQLERIAIAIFLGFIILVAALNIVSTLTMLVMEKAKDIAILRAMGSKKHEILKIFVIDGMIIGLVGTLLGSVMGFFICYLLKTNDVIKSLIPFDSQVYPVSEFPVKIEPLYFITIAIASMFICLLATLYPSIQASRRDPIEALRYE